MEELAVLEQMAPAIVPVSSQGSIQELALRFLATQDVAASSKATYGRQLKRFIAWLEETGRIDNLLALKREDILAYRDSLSASGKSSYTVSGYLVAVRRFFEWLEAERIFPNVARGVKGAKKAKGFRKDCLTAEQARQVLSAIDCSTPEGLRDYALVNLLLRTGIRTIEAARAEVGDLRQQSGQAVLWVQGKGRDTKDEFVVLTQDAVKPLRKWLSSRGSLTAYAPLFSSRSPKNTGEAMTTRSLSRIVKNALVAAGLDDSRLTAHSMRHTALTLALIGGAPLEQVQAMARHSDPRTTMIYVHNVNRVEHAAEQFVTF